MNYNEAIAECRRLEACGIIAEPSIVVFCRDDNHVYTVRIIGYGEASGAIVPR
jgi:hypothetical protein